METKEYNLSLAIAEQLSIEENSEHPEDFSYISGLGLYTKAISAILGAGVLYMHVGIFDGGVLAWLVSFFVCVISCIYVAEATYIVLQENRSEKEWRKSNSNYLNAVSDSDSDSESSKIDISVTNDYNIKESINFISLTDKSWGPIKFLLQIAIFFQALASLNIYMGLIMRWTLSIFMLVTRTLHLSDKVEKIIYISVHALVISACFIASISSLHGNRNILAFFSAGCIFLLLFILLAISGIVSTYSISVVNFSKGIPYNYIVQLLIGQHTYQSFLSGFACILFALNSQQNIPYYLSQMQISRKRKFAKVILFSLFGVSIIFLGIGIAGYYILYGTDIKLTDILTNMESFSEKLSSTMQNNASMLFYNKVFLFFCISIKICMIPILLTSYLWQVIMCRTVILSFFKKKVRNYCIDKFKKQFYIYLGILLNLIVVLVYISGIDLYTVIKIVGGLATSYISLFIPAYLIYTCRISKTRIYSFLDIFNLFVFLSIFLMLVSYIFFDIFSQSLLNTNLSIANNTLPANNSTTPSL